MINRGRSKQEENSLCWCWPYSARACPEREIKETVTSLWNTLRNCGKRYPNKDIQPRYSVQQLDDLSIYMWTIRISFDKRESAVLWWLNLQSQGHDCQYFVHGLFKSSISAAKIVGSNPIRSYLLCLYFPVCTEALRPDSPSQWPYHYLSIIIRTENGHKRKRRNMTADKLDSSEARSEVPGKFWNVVLEKDEGKPTGLDT
jgi:hypothetical protein